MLLMEIKMRRSVKERKGFVVGVELHGLTLAYSKEPVLFPNLIRNIRGMHWVA